MHNSYAQLRNIKSKPSPIHASWHWNRMQGMFFFVTRHISLFNIKFSWNTKLLWLSFQSMLHKMLLHTCKHFSYCDRQKDRRHTMKTKQRWRLCLPTWHGGTQQWPTPSMFCHLRNIWREQVWRKVQRQTSETVYNRKKIVCVCVWLNPHKTQNINPRVENREDEEWDTEEEKQKEMSAVSFRAQREDEREDEGASTQTERWLVIKK